MENYGGTEEAKVEKGKAFIEGLVGKPTSVKIKSLIGKGLNSVGIENKWYADFKKSNSIEEVNKFANNMGIKVDYPSLSLGNYLNLMLSEVFNEEGFAFPEIIFDSKLDEVAKWIPERKNIGYKPQIGILERCKKSNGL